MGIYLQRNPKTMSVHSLKELLINIEKTLPLASDAVMRGNIAQLKLFLGPAFRGLVLQEGRGTESNKWQTNHDVQFDWVYNRNYPQMKKLYDAANSTQWHASLDIDWSHEFNPLDTVNHIIPDSFCPSAGLPHWTKLTQEERADQRQSFLSWMLSQILHGEQGALLGAAQVMQAVPWLDGKLLGSSQIADEGRHVEVFHRYLSERLKRMYQINDNLYVLTEVLMTDPRWDVKFLGLQIMVEGFGLGAFTLIRNIVTDPTLRNILKLVIMDEARHVNYGVLALERFYASELNEREIAEREDLAFEISLLLQRRFLAHEIHEEYWSTKYTVKEWEHFVDQTELMRMFRRSMFRLIIPNLKRIRLLSDRIKPRYEKLGVLQYENSPTIYEMTTEQTLAPA